MRSFVPKIQLVTILIFLSEITTGCMVGPDYRSPESPKVKFYTSSPMPDQTVKTIAAGKAGKLQHFLVGKEIPKQWWFLFHSPAINNLVTTGLTHSPNLASARAALTQAQETMNAQIGATLFPSLSTQVTADRERFSEASLGLTSGSVFNFYNPAFNISYMLDIFGGARREIEALRAQVDYQAFEWKAAYLTLTSNIVTMAITAASFEAQVKATQELIRSQEKTLVIMQQQYRLGGISGADILSQETQLAQIRATLPPLEQSFMHSLHVLAVLVGSFPSDTQFPELNLDQLSLPEKLPVSLPSSLVRQRPDILAAEALLQAANAQIGVATANLFPQITLNGSYGWETLTPSQLFRNSSSAWDMGAALAQPIFNGGSLRAKRRTAIAGYEQAAAQYRQTVLLAFQNVADTLRAIQNDAQAFRAQNQAETAAKRTLHMVSQQYRLGGVSYLSLLNAEKQYQQIKINRIKAQAARYNDTVALYQSLGGGWWNKNGI